MAQAQPILMPKFGQMVEDSTILSWRKKEGDTVATGEVLFEVETDKANMEVESFLDGTLLKITVPAGVTVPVQTPVAFVGAKGDAVPEFKMPVKQAAPSTSASAPAPERGRAVPLQSATVPAPSPTAVPSSPAQPGRLRISPRALRLAKEKVIDPAPIIGTGPGGRITEKDVIGYLSAKGYDKLSVSPAAMELAAREKIDLLFVSGTGDNGRIGVADIERAVSEKPKPMSKMRQTIAQRLTHSFTTTPHIFVTVEADMTDLFSLRAEIKKQGGNFTVTDFIMKSVIEALVEFPHVNSTTDGRSVWWHSKVHLGLAVSMDKGLVVPVIRCADDLALQELHDRAAELVQKARDGRLLPDEMTGSTFTVSNMGMLDVENFCAIINPGEGAILAVASTVKKPVVRNDSIVVRQIMKMTLSADHRNIDGSMAAQFVNAIKGKLEDVNKWRTLI